MNAIVTVLQRRTARSLETRVLAGREHLVSILFLRRSRSHLMANSCDSLGACTCEKAADGGLLPTETDFTTKAK